MIMAPRAHLYLMPRFSLRCRASAFSRAGHAEETPKPHAAAADRFTGERIVRKSREKPRDRDCAFEPRQCHPCALMRAGGEGEVAVRRAADVELVRIGKLRRVAVGGADAERDRRACLHLDATELQRLDDHAVAKLVRAF